MPEIKLGSSGSATSARAARITSSGADIERRFARALWAFVPFPAQEADQHHQADQRRDGVLERANRIAGATPA